MGFLMGSPKVNAPTPPPAAAHPAVLGSTQTALIGSSAKKAGGAAEGMGFDNTIQTSPQGLKAPAAAKATLLG